MKFNIFIYRYLFFPARSSSDGFIALVSVVVVERIHSRIPAKARIIVAEFAVSKFVGRRRLRMLPLEYQFAGYGYLFF